MQQFAPACFSLFFLDLLPMLITSSQSWSLCRRSRASCFCSLQNPSVLSELLVSSGTTIRILKLRRSLDAYIANRLAIKGFRRRTFLLCLPSDPATRSKPPCIRIEETPLFQVDSPALNVLTIAVAWLASSTMPSSTMPIRSQEAPQATVDHRPPDSRLLEGRDVRSSRRGGRTHVLTSVS